MNYVDHIGSNRAVEEAKQALQNGARGQARLLASRSTELNPQNEEAWLILAALASPNDSLEYLQKALQINPSSERARKGMEWARARIQKEEIHDQFLAIANRGLSHPDAPVLEDRPALPTTLVQERLPDMPTIPTVRSSPITEEELWQIDTARIVTPGRSVYNFILNGFFTAYHQISINGTEMGELHPHTFRLQIVASAELITRNNRVIVSYESIRTVVERICKAYEGKTLNSLPPFRNLQPTTENLVGVIAQQLDKLASGKQYKIYEVTLMESPTVGVVYRNMNIVQTFQ
jgi:6-pyruvoyl-tetrahydropterin synthase